MKTPSYLDWSRTRLLQHVGHIDQVAGVRLVEAMDGLAQGSRVAHVWTGTGLDFDVIADRALDVARCSYRGVPLAWMSPTGYVHPAYYSARGEDWLRSYQGGLFTTCGLDHFGSSVSVGRHDYPLHGRIGNLPARLVECRSGWKPTPDGSEKYCIEVEGEVRQTRVFGEHVVMRRCITTTLGSNRIRIDDTVTNEGFAPQRHMIAYHFNIGYPLVSEDSRLIAEVEMTIPHDEESARGLNAWHELQPPTAHYTEQNFWHMPTSRGDGSVQVELVNPALGLGLRWSYLQHELPVLLQWKMMGEGLYLMGIEPCNTTGATGNAAVEPEALLHLAPQESCHYGIDIEVIDDVG
ncbi:MAG: aldose 1-epimerase family protein [Chloroflexi bacterium]|nr:aldose 1-epimerase family protein [Chloroflexota bacterium]